MASQVTPAPSKCPWSHLPIEFLKKIGPTVEKIGESAAIAAISAALGTELKGVL